MEEQKKEIKTEVGNIYGSRISHNGKWLNLLVNTTHNGEVIRVCVPVRINNEKEGKPSASVDLIACKAVIECVNVFEDRRDAQTESASIPDDSELPF